MDRKFQVFVSSTYADLVEERQDTLKSILDLGHIPSGMEGFFAADQEQLTYIKKIIDECDYYILIVAGRYGSVGEDGVSFTEKEYDYAVAKGMTVLAFIHSDVSDLPTARVDTDPKIMQCLKSFKERVAQKRLVSFWKDREHLKANVIISLHKAIADAPGIGWVRGNTVASEDILVQLNESRNEVERLRVENERLQGEMKPRVDNIASLDDEFEFRYNYYTQDGRYKQRGTMSLSWADILRLVGPACFSPAQQGTIVHCLEQHVTLVRGVRPRSLGIVFADVDTIKMQLSAYGFVSIFPGNSVQGGVAEFIQLTDLGKRVLLEVSAVRSSPVNALALGAQPSL